MPVIIALLGAIMSGLFMWMVWGNGMEVVNHWLDKRADQSKQARDAKAIAEARDRAARAPLRAIEDVREAALVLLCILTRARGEMTEEQRVLIAGLVRDRLMLEGKAENHISLAEFAVKNAPSLDSAVHDVTPLLFARLDDTQKSDLMAMLNEVASLHGGATDKQSEIIERLTSRLGVKFDE